MRVLGHGARLQCSLRYLRQVGPRQLPDYHLSKQFLRICGQRLKEIKRPGRSYTE